MATDRLRRLATYTLGSVSLLAILAFGIVLFYFDRNEDRLFFVGRDIVAAALPDESAGIPWDTVRVATDDGRKALLLQSRLESDSTAWVIDFHGAANTLGSEESVEHHKILYRSGFNVLSVELRGYGLLTDVPPSEQGIYADARAAWRYLTYDLEVEPSRIVLYGSSLGAAAVTLLASEQNVGGLITNGAFTSAPELTRVHYRWLPAGVLMNNRFDNLARAPSIKTRWTILHGNSDEVVPVEQAMALAAAAPNAELIIFDGGHESAFEPDYLDKATPVLREFSQQLASASPEKVTIGTQVWAARNLAERFYRNGEPIPHAATPEEFWDYGVRGIGAWCYAQGKPESEADFGLLYNWYAVADERGLGGEGWHVPTDAEWGQLELTLGPDSAGTLLKTKEGWANGGGGTNESGFGAVAAGFRWHTGAFEGEGIYASWWTATDYSQDEYFAWYRGVGADYSHVHSDSSSKYFGFSVRLLADKP